MAKSLYMNRETGEILTYKEAVAEAEELYDYGDPTNPLTLDEYYQEITEGAL